jgi:D-alanyl-D-alanine carboxypeptidase/D-alanyl-D-alanine-endopeptidase (penicillin-binding protein 4)
LKRRVLIFVLASGLLAALIVHWRESRPVGIEPSRYAEFSNIIEEAAQRPGLASAAIGVCVLNGKGETLVDYHAQTAFIPASSLKTLTTATALEVMGPDFRFETQLRVSAPIKDGAIDGDLTIVGGADPMLSLEDLAGWATELKSKGVQRITGRIVGDGRLLRGTIYHDFWNWGDIGNGYGSGVSGLNLEHNRYEASFDAGATEGAPATFLGAAPAPPDVQWINEVLTGPASSGDGVVIHGGERATVIHLRGTVPLGAQRFGVTGAAPDPPAFAAHHLRAALLAAGIEVQGAAVSAATLQEPKPSTDSPANGVVLVTHRSPPLIEIVTSIHANSDNHETECVYRLLGVRAGKAPADVVREHWRARGLEFEGLRLEDGCGLARANFIRPLDLAKLQYLAAHGPRGAEYKASLLSKENGTLRWKGGAMSGVRSTTGYVIGISGEEYSFAYMVNHYADAAAVSALREALIAAMRRL